MKKTYRGSCHCGKVRFEADIDFSQGTGRCNCSYCAKVRNWSVTIKPEEFRLLCDEVETSDYQFGTNSAHHRFCKTCGLHAYGSGYVEQIGGAYYAVSIPCLEDVTPEELAVLPVKYMDGLHDNWWNQPKITSYL
ncbi:GFA family protein [Rhizobium sp. KVB221]|uniref:GFA family protein n=1 Tax=Rhizobium setariae TaxID=2801340 RepID=A0A937CKA0_9HYPH|nr:GFA family protein [Rhizobium setariae]